MYDSYYSSYTEFLQVERRLEMMQSQDKSSDAVVPPQPVIAKRRGSYLWRVLQTKLFTRSQLSRNNREPGVFEDEGSKEERWGTEVATDIVKEKGQRLSTISEESCM